MVRCENNPEKLFTTKVGEYILSGFPMSAISPLKDTKISMMFTEVKIA